MEHIDDDPEMAEWWKKCMDANMSQMCKSIATAMVAFVSGGALVYIGVSLLREGKKSKLEEGNTKVSSIT